MVLKNRRNFIKWYATVLKWYATVIKRHTTVLKRHTTVLKRYTTVLKRYTTQILAEFCCSNAAWDENFSRIFVPEIQVVCI